MRRGVDAARATTHDRHAHISELIGQLPRRLQAVMRRQPRANHRDGVFVPGRQPAFDIEHNRRIVNLPQQPGIVGVGRRENVAAVFLDAFQLVAEVH